MGHRLGEDAYIPEGVMVILDEAMNLHLLPPPAGFMPAPPEAVKLKGDEAVC